MLTFVIIVGGSVLLVGLIALVYLSSKRNNSDETGRRTEVQQGPATPARTEGRDT